MQSDDEHRSGTLLVIAFIANKHGLERRGRDCACNRRLAAHILLSSDDVPGKATNPKRRRQQHAGSLV
jgi:hypothetical protein